MVMDRVSSRELASLLRIMKKFFSLLTQFELVESFDRVNLSITFSLGFLMNSTTTLSFPWSRFSNSAEIFLNSRKLSRAMIVTSTALINSFKTMSNKNTHITEQSANKLKSKNIHFYLYLIVDSKTDLPNVETETNENLQ